MKMCQPHWDMLRAEVAAQGLADWVAPDGETAAAQLVDEVRRGEHTRVNYDPLMAAHNMILGRALDVAGIVVLLDDFGCPICRFNAQRSPDGRCLCDNPQCPGKAPGSVADHETWLTGPASAVTAAREFMVEQGWIS